MRRTGSSDSEATLRKLRSLLQTQEFTHLTTFKHRLLQDITLNFQHVVLIGPTGIGKTTLLKDIKKDLPKKQFTCVTLQLQDVNNRYDTPILKTISDIYEILASRLDEQVFQIFEKQLQSSHGGTQLLNSLLRREPADTSMRSHEALVSPEMVAILKDGMFQFFSALAHTPLVILLQVDDVHYANEETMRWLKSLVEISHGKLVCVYTCRDDRLSALETMLSEDETKIKKINMPTVPKPDLQAWLTKHFKIEDERFTKQIVSRSGGSPLDIYSVLINAVENVALTIVGGEWVYHSDMMQAVLPTASVTNEAMRLMSGVDEYSKTVLAVSAVIGDRFTIEEMCELLQFCNLSDTDAARVSHCVGQLCVKGILAEDSGSEHYQYQFAHAQYAVMAKAFQVIEIENEKKILNWLGKHVKTHNPVRAALYFNKIPDDFDLSSLDLVKLNIVAITICVKNANYILAQELAEAICVKMSRQIEYFREIKELTYICTLYLLASKVQFSCGKNERARELAEQLIDLTTDLEQRAEATLIGIKAGFILGDIPKVHSECVKILGQLSYNISHSGSKEELVHLLKQEMEHTQQQLSKHSIFGEGNELVESAQADSFSRLDNITVEILAYCALTSYFSQKMSLFKLSVSKAVGISVGSNDFTSSALCEVWYSISHYIMSVQKYREGYQLAKLAYDRCLSLLNKGVYPVQAPFTMLLFGACVAHYGEPLSNSIAYLSRGQKIAEKVGDTLTATLCHGNVINIGFDIGLSLQTVVKQATHFIDNSLEAHPSYPLIYLVRLTASSLIDGRNYLEMDRSQWDDQKTFDRLSTENNNKAFFLYRRLQLACFFGQADLGCRVGKELLPLLETAPGFFFTEACHFYYAFALITSHQTADDLLQDKQSLEQLRKCVQQLKQLKNIIPVNFAMFCELIDAEMSRLGLEMQQLNLGAGTKITDSSDFAKTHKLYQSCSALCRQSTPNHDLPYQHVLSLSQFRTYTHLQALGEVSINEGYSEKVADTYRKWGATGLLTYLLPTVPFPRKLSAQHESSLANLPMITIPLAPTREHNAMLKSSIRELTTNLTISYGMLLIFEDASNETPTTVITASPLNISGVGAATSSASSVEAMDVGVKSYPETVVNLVKRTSNATAARFIPDVRTDPRTESDSWFQIRSEQSALTIPVIYQSGNDSVYALIILMDEATDSNSLRKCASAEESWQKSLFNAFIGQVKLLFNLHLSSHINRQYELYLQNLSIGIIEIGRDLRCRNITRVAAKLLGYDDIISETFGFAIQWTDVLSPRDVNNAIDFFASLRQLSNQDQTTRSFICSTLKGRRLTLKCTPMLNMQQSVEGYYIEVFDITDAVRGFMTRHVSAISHDIKGAIHGCLHADELKEVFAQVVQAIEELATSNPALIGNLNDVVKAPSHYTASEQYSQLASKVVQLLSDIENVTQSAEGASRLVSDILDVYRWQSAELQLQEEPFDLIEALRMTKNTYQANFGRRGMKCQLSTSVHEVTQQQKRLSRLFSPQGSPQVYRVQGRGNQQVKSYHVHGDKKLLMRVIGNLLDNAAKYAEENTTVLIVPEFIEEREPEAAVEISVVSSSKGLTESQITKIRREFSQAHNGNGNNGIGFGLTFCEEVLKALKAESFPGQDGNLLGIDSVTGVGMRFYFKIPLKRIEAPSPSTTPRLVQQSDDELISQLKALYQQLPTVPCVYIVDDERLNRFLLKKHVQKATGLSDENIKQFQDGEPVVKAFKEAKHAFYANTPEPKRPVLIIMDLGMTTPGNKAAREIKAFISTNKLEECPIICHTAGSISASEGSEYREHDIQSLFIGNYAKGEKVVNLYRYMLTAFEMIKEHIPQAADAVSAGPSLSRQ